MRTLDGSGRLSDLRLLRKLCAMLWQYLTVGGRLRREYRLRESRGEVFWVDAQGPTEHREQSLRRDR
jgi:hypothetical protein